MPQLQLTPVSDWLKGELVQLPSGKVVEYMELDTLSMVMESGDTPNFVLRKLMDGLNQKPASKQTEAKDEPEDMLKLVPLLNTVTRAMLVQPPIVETVEEMRAGKGITLQRVSFQDKMALFMLGIGGKARLDVQRFPGQSAVGLDAVPAESEVSTASVGAAGDTA